jgi:hypothetical protein
MLARCIASEDVFFGPRENLIVNYRGTLRNTRFPLWRDFVTSMKWQHSGYQLRPDFSIERRTIALSTRYLSCITDLATQRKIYLRRRVEVKSLIREWEKAVQKLAYWAWMNQEQPRVSRAGFAWEFYNPNSTGYGGTTYKGSFGYCKVPFLDVRQALEDARLFVNLAAVAGGMNTVVSRPIFEPPPGGYDAAYHFSYLRSLLNPSTSDFRVIAVRGRTKNLEILRAMINLIAKVERRYSAFLRDKGKQLPYDNRPDLPRRRAQAQARVWNEFASCWPAIQADLLSLLGLMFSWQLTWEPVESGRAAAGTPPLKRLDGQRYTGWKAPGVPSTRPRVTSAPNLSYRYATARPQFVPFRLNDVLNVTDYDDEFERKRREQEEKARREEEQRKRKEAEDAEKARRAKALEALIEKRKAEWLKADNPSPNDPTDYRNWTSADWWKSIGERDWLEMGANVVDVLLSIEAPWEPELGVSRRSPPGHLQPKGTTKSVPGEFLVPHKRRAGVLPWPEIRRFVVDYVKDTAKDAAQTYAEEWVEDRVNRILQENKIVVPQYSPRQLWPPSLEDALQGAYDDYTTTIPSSA